MKPFKSVKWKCMISSSIIVIILVCGVLWFGGTNETKHEIIPSPVRYESSKGQFILTKEATIYIKGNNEEERQEIYQIAELLKSKIQPSTGFKLDIIESDQVPKGSLYLTTIGGKESQGDEGYTLEVTTDQIKLVAYKPEGLYRGTMTLRQLFPPAIERGENVTDAEWRASSCLIEDKPEYSYRGLMIDTARHFVPVEDLKRQIDLASTYKINKLHLHLSDDQGWRLEIKKWPDLTTIGGRTAVDGDEGGYYTQEEFKDIVQYANERYIEVIPEFDMPGHTNASLASYGFLNPDGNKKDLYTGTDVGFSTLMCQDEKTYEWIEDVIKEVVDISPSPYIHIGGDESNQTKQADYSYFIGRVSKMVEEYDKIPIGWEPCDISKEASSNLIFQFWQGNNEEAINKKMQMIISPADKAYLDMKYDASTPYGLTWAGYNPIKDAYAFEPTKYAPKELILGIEAPLWTETINNPESMDYMVYPRLLGHAEIGWTSKKNRGWNDYVRRLVTHGERMSNQGINYYQDPSIWK